MVFFQADNETLDVYIDGLCADFGGSISSEFKVTRGIEYDIWGGRLSNIYHMLSYSKQIIMQNGVVVILDI